MLVAGFYYITSFGDEERQTTATRIIGATVLALIIIASSYVMVALFVPS